MVDAVNRRSAYRLPVETRVQLQVGGMRMTASAMLANLSVSGCRVRSWIVLQRGSAVSFEWSSETLTVRLNGTIVSRSASTRGAAYEYGIAFSNLNPEDAAALAKEIAAAQRRDALARADRPAQLSINADRVNRRHAYRASVEFPVTLCFPEQNLTLDARATDLSAGGLRVICDQPFLHAGDDVILRFRLSSGVLNVYPDGAPERRPFEETAIRSRVQRRLEDRSARPTYGIAFVEIDAYSREEIARFINASQLAKLGIARGIKIL